MPARTPLPPPVGRPVPAAPGAASALPPLPLRLRPAVRRGALVAGGLVLAGVCAAFGVALGMVGGALGPAAILALPLLPAVVLAGLHDPRLAVAVTFVAMPVGIQPLPPLPLQVMDVAVLATVGLVLAGRLATGRAPLGWSSHLWWAVVLLTLATAGTPGAVDVDAAVRGVIQLAVGVLLAAAVLGAVRRFDDVRWLLGAFLGVVAVACLLAVPEADQQQASFGGAVVTGRATSIFVQPNELGSFCAMAVFAATGVALGGRSSGSRRAGAVVAGLAVLGLVLSLSRGAWVGTAIGILALAAVLPVARRRLVVLGVPALVLAAGMAVLAPGNTQVQIVQERLGSLAEPTSNPYDDRPVIYAEGVRQVVDDPILGQGPGNFTAASRRSGPEANTVAAVHAHNALLTVAAELGLPAAAALVGLTLALASVALRTTQQLRTAGRGRDAALVACLGVALLTVAGHGIVDFPLRNPILFVTVWSLTALLLAAGRAAADELAAAAPARGR